MDLLENTEGDTVHSDAECGSEEFELIFTDNNGGFASRRECKQSFVNAARLERHLAVHQVFGAYLCPLCGKTYKYEYNLFFHWRKTCQYLNELIEVEQRKEMDVNSLRLLVEEVVLKRNETEPVDIGISEKALFHGKPTSMLEMPIDPQSSPLARACTICGILVHRNHHPQHEALHSATTETGLRLLDKQSPSGGYFCDLCGVAFRSKENLYSHWRSSCVEIMANIEPGSELFLSDLELKAMVLDLLWRLRRVARQTPLRAIRTRREYVEEMEPLINLGTDGGGGSSYSSNRRAPENGKVPVPSSGDPEGKALVFMDDYINPADTVVDVDGELVNIVSVDRGKWNIPEDGKPLECPDCFRQFANAGRLERHISGFHSHYGPFKYEYNLLFHYRHSCAYTKLLVGADVRKVLDAASLRKLVSHIKQSDPQLRPGCSRLINIKRRPSLRAVPRNIRCFNANAAKGKLKHRLNEGTKCPVCGKVSKLSSRVLSCFVNLRGVMFYGQKSLDKHIGTVHLLNYDFLDKAITRESSSPKLACSASEAENEYSRSVFSSQPSKLPAEQDSAEEEAPPVLEAEGPSESVPSTRCVDVNGEDIHDFDAEQLSELDLMLHTGQLSLGDLVITSVCGEDVEYRIAAGTRHGSQIILEKSKPSCTLEDEDIMLNKPVVHNVSDDIPSSVSSSQKEVLDTNSLNQETRQLQDESRNNDGVLEYVEAGDSPQYLNQEDAEVQYESDQLMHYEIHDSEGHNRRRVVRFSDDGHHLLEYLDDENFQCDGFVEYVDDENGHQIIEFIENGTDMVQYLIAENVNDSEVIALLKSQTPTNAEDPERGKQHLDSILVKLRIILIMSEDEGMSMC
ncbi:unnamed protein product [Angiostrongylus costaricensis]|uniref:C2H2-type domain-containing protein n=1 Tax=Angiostrongylus costaricensis TaxID=334426 RepID=A0A0R3PAE4_ANGCS|nr:unnamed protein product [Angiostrongylus costaricensis]